MIRPLTSPSFPVGLVGNRTIEQARADREQFICPRCGVDLARKDNAAVCNEAECPLVMAGAGGIK